MGPGSLLYLEKPPGNVDDAGSGTTFPERGQRKGVVGSPVERPHLPAGPQQQARRCAQLHLCLSQSRISTRYPQWFSLFVFKEISPFQSTA